MGKNRWIEFIVILFWEISIYILGVFRDLVVDFGMIYCIWSNKFVNVNVNVWWIINYFKIIFFELIKEIDKLVWKYDGLCY